MIHLPNLTSEDSGSMRKFYDKVIGHVRSVDSMGDKFAAETLAPVLVPLVVDKLPKRVVEKWELEVKDVQDNYLSTKALFTFLEQIIRAKESAQLPHQSQSSSQRWKLAKMVHPSITHNESHQPLRCVPPLVTNGAVFAVRTTRYGHVSAFFHCQ